MILIIVRCTSNFKFNFIHASWFYFSLKLTQWFHDRNWILVDAMGIHHAFRLVSYGICSCYTSMLYYHLCCLFYVSGWKSFPLENCYWMCCYHLISYPNYCHYYLLIVVAVVVEAIVAESPANKFIIRGFKWRWKKP